MFIKVDAEQLGDAYSKCAGVVNPRSTKEVLQNILFRATDKLTLIGTNTETSVLVEVPAEIIKPGNVLLPVDRLGKFVKEFDGQLSFELVDTDVHFTAPNAQYKIPTASPDEFPGVKLIEDNAVEVLSEELELAFRKTVFACDRDSARYALGGVRIEDWTVVGCDGRRMSICPVPSGTGEIRVLILEKAVQLMQKMLTEEKAIVSHDLSNVQVKCGNTIVNSRQLEGRFPNWQVAVAKKENKNRAVLTAGAFYSAIRQAAITADVDTRGIVFSFRNSEIQLSSRTETKGQAAVSVPVEYSGSDTEIRLDFMFVSEFLKTCDPEEVVSLYVGTATEPMLIEGADGAKYTVMAMAM